MTHTLVALVADHPGVLTRVASLFRRRGFNIASLAVGHSEEPGYSRMTIAVDGNDAQMQQCAKQLYKLIDVVEIENLTAAPRVDRELALVRVKTAADQRPAVADIAEIFHGEVVDVGRGAMIVQLAGDSATIDRFLEVVAEYGILEISRTGAIAMARENGTSHRGKTIG